MILCHNMILRFDLAWTCQEAINHIAQSLNFPSGTTAGIQLSTPYEIPNVSMSPQSTAHAPNRRTISNPDFAIFDPEKPLSFYYDTHIKKHEFIEYSYKDSPFKESEITEEDSTTTEMSPEMWNNPDMEGQLIKQGHVVKNWKLRWFVLQHNRLFYFKSKPNKVNIIDFCQLNVCLVHY